MADKFFFPTTLSDQLILNMSNDSTNVQNILKNRGELSTKHKLVLTKLHDYILLFTFSLRKSTAKTAERRVNVETMLSSLRSMVYDELEFLTKNIPEECIPEAVLMLSDHSKQGCCRECIRLEKTAGEIPKYHPAVVPAPTVCEIVAIDAFAHLLMQVREKSGIDLKTEGDQEQINVMNRYIMMWMDDMSRLKLDKAQFLMYESMFIVFERMYLISNERIPEVMKHIRDEAVKSREVRKRYQATDPKLKADIYDSVKIIQLKYAARCFEMGIKP